MDVSKYSQSVIKIIKKANQIAIRNGNSEVTDFHLMYAILQDADNKLREYFKELGVVLQSLEDDLDKAISKLRTSKGLTSLFTSRAYQRALLISEEISRNQYQEHILVEHLLLALLREVDMPAAKLANQHGLIYQDLQKLISKKFNETLLEGINAETINLLEKYGRILTKEAIEGKLDPVIGREEETRNAIRILSRRIKNNPVLIGEAGVGKTAIVEGIVQRIVKGDVPDNLKDKTVFSLDMTSLVAGAKYRGDFEERLKKILEIIKDSQGKIILFIDEIHNIIGSGSSSGAMDTANMLKPMLARGEILTIGATTIEEYRKHIEVDGALDRRFQTILVEEPSVETSIAIMRGIKAKYENYHLIKITDRALTEAVRLSKRYLPERKLPDVVIDVVDEACSLVKMVRDQKPEMLDNLHRSIVQLEMEKIALKNENDEISQYRMKEKEEEISRLEKELEEQTKNYELEKERQEEIVRVEREINLAQLEIELAKEKRDFTSLDKYLDLEERLSVKLKELENTKEYFPLKTKVTVNEVKEIISKLSGMPKGKLESNKLANINEVRENLKNEFVGSADMIDTIINSYMISESGLIARERPIGSFLISGPSGSGKSYIGELLAKHLFEGEKSLIRFDMSEFSDKSSITKLIGAPPGYVGYEFGGALTESLRTKPYSVLVFENIENAHYEVQNLVLQIIQGGEVKDNKGRVINVKNTIVLLNTTARNVSDVTKGDRLQVDFKKYVDNTFYLEELDLADTRKFINLNLVKLADELKEHQIILKWKEEFIEKFISYVNSKNMDTRDIKKLIEQEIYFLICEKNLQSEFETFTTLYLEIDDEHQFVVKI